MSFQDAWWRVFPYTTDSLWERLLSEIITGDAFGADRIDYLLRDSLHYWVAYARFDHQRLITELQILTASADAGGGSEPEFGLAMGGLRTAEALLLARYQMFSQA